MDIRTDFGAAPVPVRMTCRFSNGISLSYHARALSLNPRSLRVLSADALEVGVQLNVTAPFLKGISACRVLRSARSNKQAGFFELELLFLREPGLAPAEAAEAGEQTARPVLGGSQDWMVRVVAAASLADRLEESIGSRFSLAWQQLPAGQRPYYLVACVGAVALLLQGKGCLDIRHALGSLETTRTALPIAEEKLTR